jgi:ABC-type Fe3+/spermidine/putrescine transport system ATPase subunit
MTKLTISQVSKTYADGTEALRGIQVSAGSGEIVAILGGSGCGKTTLLRLVAGLDEPSGGEIRLDDVVVAGTCHQRRVPGAAPVAVAERDRQYRIWRQASDPG